MVKINDIYFDQQGKFYKVVYTTEHFVRFDISYNNIDYMPYFLNFKVDEIERKINKQELFYYTKTSWLLYGKK